MSFDPVPDTPLQNGIASPKWRENRLYQASFLMKDYGIKASDFDVIFNDDGFLADADPKMRLAYAHPDHFPMDINKAARDELLMVPGIGPISANRIIQARPITSEQELARMGVVISRARPFIEINGSKQTNLHSFMGVGS
jgi:predicted DNA-binding helix-hairpin-helix protein